MAGRNQHHIPQFYQRGFGITRSGKPKEIWEFSRNAAPERRLIKEAAAEFDFYSEPSADGSKTLDDRITEVESPLADIVASLRKLPAGAAVDTKVAAEIVAHLAPRTSHLRLSFAKGMATLFRGATEVFGDTGNLKRLLGLDNKSPSDHFRKHLTPALEEDPRFQAFGLPTPLLEQVAFRLAREKFDEAFADQASLIETVISGTFAGSEQAVRESHNSALSQLLDRNVRRDDLSQFAWSVEAAPSENAILPDCVALGYTADAPPSPFMFVGRDDLLAVAMPLTSDRLLVGRPTGQPLPDLTQFNANAAACCHSFFLANANKAAFADLTPLIGARSEGEIHAAIEGVLGEYRAPLADQAAALAAPTSAPHGDEPPEPAMREFGYQLSFLGCANEEEAQNIAEAVRAIIAPASRILPLHRLDGITFAADYVEGLASVDRGVPGAEAPKTVDEAIGHGVAMTVAVMREGVSKSRIVLAGGIGPALADEDHPAAAWALHIMVHQLMNVAMSHWFDDAFPGVLLTPHDDPYEMRLYAHVHASVEGYIASRFSAGFATDDIVDAYRELLIASLAHANSTIIPARLAYRVHGDMDAFLRIAYPAAAQVLQFAAKLVGHCDGLEISARDAEGSLQAALEEHGFGDWLKTLQEDFQAIWERRGRWQSLDELYVINRQFERLLWQFGIFPWLPENGDPRVEIPLATDAIALLKGIADGTIPPPEGFDMATVPPELLHELGIEFQRPALGITPL